MFKGLSVTCDTTSAGILLVSLCTDSPKMILSSHLKSIKWNLMINHVSKKSEPERQTNGSGLCCQTSHRERENDKGIISTQ